MGHSEDSAYVHSVKFLMKPGKKSERLTQQFAEADVKFVKVPGTVSRACRVPALAACQSLPLVSP
jgi:hypothetical protein